MATRDDLSVRWDLSPRIITVEAPSTEITIQELHDTLRDLEDEPRNMIYPTIISSAGKEPLGGGVTVGLTSTLLNARLQFEGRPDPFIITETATAGSMTQYLIDATATFITDGVRIGDIIENETDNGYGEVVNVVSETELQTTVLSNGALWDSGDLYNIWHVVQCRVDGGNLVAEDALGAELDPIFPSAFTQVVRTSSSSATLQELEAIQFSSFNNKVWISTSGTAGTTYPAGTPQQPVNNIDDAKAIAVERGFDRLFFASSFTLTSTDNVNGYELQGAGETKTTLTLENGVSTIGCEFSDMKAIGYFLSPSAFRNMIFGNTWGQTAGGSGTMEVLNCIFEGTVTLDPAMQGQIDFISCKSGVAGTATPAFDFGGANISALFRNWSGGFRFQNFSNINNPVISMDIDSGNIIIDNTCTAGSISLRGISLLEDNSNGTSVLTSGLVFPDAIQLSSFGSFVYLDTVNGTAGTRYPQGTSAMPVGNLADAKTIAADRNINNILLTGTLVLGPTDNVDGLLFKGITAATSVIVCTAGCSTDGTQFEDCTLTGPVNGDIIVRRSGVVNVTNVGDTSLGTTFTGCALLDTVSPCIQMRNDIVHGTNNVLIIDCSSLNNSGQGPHIDLNDSDAPVVLSNYTGDLLFKNITQGNNAHISMSAGHHHFDATNTSGTYRYSGVGRVIDLGVGGGFTLDIADLQSPAQGADAVWDEQTSEHTTAGTAGETVRRVDNNAKLIPGTL